MDRRGLTLFFYFNLPLVLLGNQEILNKNVDIKKSLKKHACTTSKTPNLFKTSIHAVFEVFEILVFLEKM